MSTLSDPWHWWKRAQGSIAQGALTNSKRPSCHIMGVYPTHLERGQGCHVWDTSGKRYIDFICGLGSNLLGHGHPEIEEAAVRGFRRGSTLSLGSPLEVEYAERLQAAFPGVIERIKVLKTGTEACAAAIRIARAATGRKNVLSHGYHGWTDEFVSLTPPAHGVPRTFEHIGTLDNLEQIDEDTAAVIIEPVLVDASETRLEFLRALRAKCTETGALLVFDEIVTGFRFPMLSVSNWSRIQPDLILLGKAIGGGLPISVVGGREKVMNASEYFVSSTFAGDMVALSAALKVLDLVKDKYPMDLLWSQGARFFQTFNVLWPDAIKIKGYATRGVFDGNKDAIDLFRQEACKAGILFGSSVFFSFPHAFVTDQVLSTCQDIMLRIKTGSVRLEGEPSQSPFAQKVRSQ